MRPYKKKIRTEIKKKTKQNTKRKETWKERNENEQKIKGERPTR